MRHRLHNGVAARLFVYHPADSGGTRWPSSVTIVAASRPSLPQSRPSLELIVPTVHERPRRGLGRD
jgi:hypothetical protein